MASTKFVPKTELTRANTMHETISKSDRLLYLLRQRKMTAEQDIVVNANKFLRDLFDERITDKEKLAIENWLSTQIEMERQGWKRQLQLSMKEIEKERRQVLDYQSTIQALNERIEQRAKDVHITRERTGFINTERANGETELCALESNVSDVIDRLDLLLGDRADTMAVLGIEENGVYNAAELFRKQLCAKDAEMNNTKRHLAEELHSLRNTIEQKTKEHKEQLEKAVHELGILRALSRSQKEVIDNKAPVAMATKQLQASVELRHCIVQTDSSYHDEYCSAKTPDSGTSSSSNSGKTSTRGPPLHHSNSAPSVTEESYCSSNDYTTPRSVSHVTSHVSQCDVTPLSPRRTVVGLAERLEQAKGEVELYQRHIAANRPAVTSSEPGTRSDYEAVQAHRQAQLRKLQFASRRWPSEGFLMGVRVGEDGRVLELEAPPGGAQEAGRVHPVGMSACLRCHHIYKIKENHKNACRFHPKSRQKIEKYDGTGRLLRVAHLWECCLQNPDAQGCTSGEHI